MRPFFLPAVLAAVFLSSSASADLAVPGVEEDASVTTPEAPPKPSRQFKGVLRIGYADPLGLGHSDAFIQETAEAIEASLKGAGPEGRDVKVELKKYSELDLQLAVVNHETDLSLISSGYYI